jgi:murein DD-endopeptidase MepM/ murein hydrolase activator NlpD
MGSLPQYTQIGRAGRQHFIVQTHAHGAGMDSRVLQRCHADREALPDKVRFDLFWSLSMTRNKHVQGRVRLGLAALLLSHVAIAQPPTGGGRFPPPGDHLSMQQREKIDAELLRNVAALKRQHLLPDIVPSGSGTLDLQWPLKPAPGHNDPGYHGTSAFVDHDSTYPDHILDWNCGTRAYDLASGYNHAGIDIFLWPFTWLLMDQGAVNIVAAAPGTIIGKVDGNDDRSCPNHYSEDWNAVYVQHADGSVAWYGHMKTSSLTTKPVGERVTTGEFLGKVGSAGFSNGPHLHFELHSALENYAIIDPYEGTCNAAPSQWAQQRPYVDSAINKLATHSTPPDFRGVNCPDPIAEVPHLSDHFMPGSDVYFAAYYRDQTASQETRFTVTRPDGTTFAEWTFRMADSTDEPYQEASSWYWRYALPAAAATGTWHIRARYEGIEYDHPFFVGDVIFTDGFE